MSLAVEILSWLLLGTGSLILVVAGVAIIRMPTFYTRVHAASVNEALAPALILSGLMLQADGQVEPILKLILVLLFLLLTGPLASHALAKSAYKHGVEPGSFAGGAARGAERGVTRGTGSGGEP